MHRSFAAAMGILWFLTAPVVGAVTGAASAISGWLGGARHILLEGAFVALGLVLLGLGGWKVVSPARISKAVTDTGKRVL